MARRKALENDWSLRSVRKHFDARLVDQNRAVRAALKAAQRATNKADDASEKRFESVNEFRGQLGDQARTFMPRAESNAQRDATNIRIDAAESRIAALTGRLDALAGRSGGLSSAWGYLVGALGSAALIVGVVLAIIHK